MQKKEMEQRKRKKLRCGLTLVEVTVATALTLLLLFGALDVYVAAGRLSLSTAASCYASTDGANAVRHVVGDAEEARWLALPGEGGWTSPSSAPVSAFQTTSAGGTVNTGVELVFSGSAAASVQDRSGSAFPVPPALYDRSQDAAPAATLWIYRADSDGTPDASAGTALWMAGTEQGQSVSRALISSLSPVQANAVSFSRPQTAAHILLPYQLQISLVSTYYSPVRQAQTSESGSTAQETSVVGKCVLLRDHEMNLDHEPGQAASYGAANASAWRSD